MNNNLTITEIKTEKEQLEERISEVVNKEITDFYKKTGIRIYTFNVSWIDTTTWATLKGNAAFKDGLCRVCADINIKI